MYSEHIIQKSTHSNYSIEVERDLVLDTAGNLTQIGLWALGSFKKEKVRIELFLRLTNKNLSALSEFPLSIAFNPTYKKFCRSYVVLEKAYRDGTLDTAVWAHDMRSWGITLTQKVELI